MCIEVISSISTNQILEIISQEPNVNFIGFQQ